jgi:hypothetical protein
MGTPIEAYEIVPITRLYEVYELRDTPGSDGPLVVVGARRGQILGPSVPVCIAGITEELTFEGKKPAHHFLLHGRYYARLDPRTDQKK